MSHRHHTTSLNTYYEVGHSARNIFDLDPKPPWGWTSCIFSALRKSSPTFCIQMATCKKSWAMFRPHPCEQGILPQTSRTWSIATVSA